MRTPLFVFRLKKILRRIGPAGLALALAGIAMVTGLSFILASGRDDSALPKPDSRELELASMEAARDEDFLGKREDRMPAAVAAEQRQVIGADLSAAEPLEISPLRSIDGTSFRRGEDTIRLAGVEGPGAGDVCRDGEIRWSCGLQARAALHNLVAGRPLTCQPRMTSGVGIVSADCELPPRGDLPSGSLAKLLVLQGWARPDATAEADLAEPSAQAKRERAGLWRGDWTIVATER